MKNVTPYTQELLLKMQLVFTAKRRKFCLIFIIIAVAVGVGLIVMDCLLEDYNTMFGGVFFLVCSFIYCFLFENDRGVLLPPIRA